MKYIWLLILLMLFTGSCIVSHDWSDIHFKCSNGVLYYTSSAEPMTSKPVIYEVNKIPFIAKCDCK